MNMPRIKKLSCGGRGPCCHVSYAHRHCEHCDEVIALAAWTWSWSYGLPYAPTVRPYQSYWLNSGTSLLVGNNFGDVGNAAAANFMTTHHGNTADFARALPEHVCP